ncbi:MAG: hydrogenase accessory protein HypB [Rhodospirillales bacterium]|nr:MAG: hydrogenase accessory protein HypB [Rhodospirillales bacterium]
MCRVCGCSATAGDNADARVAEPGAPQHHAHAPDRDHHHDHGHRHHHQHTAHGHDHGHDYRHDHRRGGVVRAPLNAVHAPGIGQARIIQVEQDILAENDRYAAANRARLKAAGIAALNLMSGPGAGKTTLLVRTIADLGPILPIAVIEGDQETSFDAERIRATGAATIQINTGRGCHLDAHMVGHAIDRLEPAPGSLLIIENVGNLVCPAGFDLGEGARVVLLSVTEGDDKPLKYPDMFHAADLLVVTKTDLMPYVAFDLERCIGFARRVNPGIDVLTVSATDGAGLDAWYDWLKRAAAAGGTTAPSPLRETVPAGR